MRRQRGRVGGFQDQMAALIEARLALGIGPPQQEHDRLVLLRHHPHDRIGEELPALALMRCRPAHLDRQHAVEQQHPLPRPMFQKAVPGPRNAQVALHLLIDVDQRRRRPHAGLHRKAQAMRLPLAMIGVLPQYHDLDRIQRGEVERAEILAAPGEDAFPRRLLRLQKGFQPLHMRGGELVGQGLAPAFVQLDGSAHAA